MCRLLAVKDRSLFEPLTFLSHFADSAKNSREYQGDGWGCAWWKDGGWNLYHNIRPIWQDKLDQFPATNIFLAHARSAFGNEGIAVENNMPFLRSPYLFIFNGELHGVRVAAEGRIGAEKLFNYMLDFHTEDLRQRFKKSSLVIRKRSRYVKAMNYIVCDGEKFYLHSFFSESPEYFTMHYRRQGEKLLVCSDPFPGERGWQPIANGFMEVMK